MHDIIILTPIFIHVSNLYIDFVVSLNGLSHVVRKSALCTDLQQRRLTTALPHRLLDAFVVCSKDISIALLWHEEVSVAEQAGFGPNW